MLKVEDVGTHECLTSRQLVNDATESWVTYRDEGSREEEKCDRGNDSH